MRKSGRERALRVSMLRFGGMVGGIFYGPGLAVLGEIRRVGQLSIDADILCARDSAIDTMV